MHTASPDVLQVAAAALGVAAASLTGFGLRHAQQRGWRWWLAACWGAVIAAVLGAVLAAAAPHLQGALHTALRVLGEALLMQWPLTMLIGLRRFHARDALPLHARVDFGLVVFGTLVIVAGFVAGSTGRYALAPAIGPWVAAVVGSLVLLYAALLALRAPQGHASPPLQALAAAQCLIAFIPLAPALLSQNAGAPVGGLLSDPLDPLAYRLVGAAFGVTVAAFVLLTLVGQRTEQQLRESRQRLRTLANMDALTQVPNRRHFNELAALALQRDRPGSAVLLMFDVDHFKAINDGFGHAAGDRALTLVSGSMLEHLRAEDAAGRLGGDEFALLLRNTDVGGGIAVAERIVLAVQRRSAEHALPTLSLSFGVVQVLGQEPLDDALRRADQALFEAKRQGRGRAVAAEGNEAQPVFSESQRLGLIAA
jgi:diguanylate cyclase